MFHHAYLVYIERRGGAMATGSGTRLEFCEFLQVRWLYLAYECKNFASVIAVFLRYNPSCNETMWIEVHTVIGSVGGIEVFTGLVSETELRV